MISKICTVCKQDKLLEEYYNSKTFPGGKQYRCKSCDEVARKAYRAKNLDSERQSKKFAQIKLKYGLSREQYESMLSKQDNKCAICNLPAPNTAFNTSTLVVDHCHDSSKVRGLLCHKCNQALGLFKESINNLISATKYLKDRS